MDFLPCNLRCPNCSSPKARFIVTLTDPDIDYARIVVYKCKCGHYLLVKRGTESFIEDWEDLEICLDIGREDLLMEVRNLSEEKFNNECLKKIERLTKLLSIWFEIVYDSIHTLEDRNLTVRLIPLGNSVRVEIFKRLVTSPLSSCVRNPVDLVHGKTYRVNNKFIFETHYVRGMLEQIKVLWFDIDEDNSTCLREILRHTFS